MANILIVDDDPSARDLLITVLGSAGHVLRTANDGVEGLAEADPAAPPDLVIADVLMPTMDGFEFVRRLRQNPAFSRTPVVFHTAAYLEAEVRPLATDCGVHHILTKPTTPEAILQLAHEVLHMVRPEISPAAMAGLRRGDLGPLTAKLAQHAATVGPRLDAMIELGLQLASEREPRKLLASFCASARKVIGAKYATVGVLDKNDRRVRYEYASGMSPEIMARLTASPVPMPVLETVLSERRPRRLRSLPDAPAAVGLPPAHPPVHAYLCAPIASPDRTYGWLCLADKLGGADFSEEDEGLAQILAAQVGRIYENGSLYAEVRRTLVQLETELVETRRDRDELRRHNADLERQLRERTAELENASQEAEAFSFSVSHDLRSPLNTIKGFSEIVLNFHGPELSSRLRDSIEAIRDGGRRLNEMINDLLSLSRVSRSEIVKMPLDLTELAGQVAEQLRRAEPGRAVDCRIAPEMVAAGDVRLIRVIFENLLGNAWKFTSQRSSGVIEVGAGQRAGRPVFFVRDNGAGFDMQYAGRLFTPFQRLHPQRAFPGNGIGLAIVQRIVRRHGGDIWVESAVDVGTTFFFTLAPADDATSPSGR